MKQEKHVDLANVLTQEKLGKALFEATSQTVFVGSLVWFNAHSLGCYNYGITTIGEIKDN